MIVLACAALVLSACGGSEESGSGMGIDSAADSQPSTAAATTTAAPATTQATTTSAAPTTEATTTTEATATTEADPPKETEAPSGQLATPEEFDVTVFQRLSESLLASTAYAGVAPEALEDSAHAACRVLLDGGTTREALDAALAESPAATAEFGSDEHALMLLVVTRGAALWCPEVIEDEDAFREDVIATIVDVFFEG